MTRWDDFVIRRSINFEEFKLLYNITCESDLLECCRRFGVEPPGELQLNSLFPVVPESVEQVQQDLVPERKKETVTRQTKKNKSKE
jgi:hypothetical protein